MSNPNRHDNPGVEGKAREKQSADRKELRVSQSSLRPFYRWSVVLAGILLTIILWTIVETGRAEQEGAAKDKSSSTESKQNQSKEGQEDKSKQAETAKEKKDDKSAKSAETGSQGEDQNWPDLSVEEKRMEEVIGQLADEMVKDPESEKCQALTNELMEIQKRVEKILENNPKTNFKKLPSAPTTLNPNSKSVGKIPQPRGKTVEKKVSQPAKDSNTTAKERSSRQITAPPNVRGARNVIRRPPVDITSKQEKNKSTETKIEAKEEKLEPKVTEKPAVAEKEAVKTDKPAVGQTAAEALPDDNFVKITVSNELIDINMLLEQVGKELKLNFIYPDGVVPTGKVKLQQHGKIHRNELLPLLESILSFSGYSMVREDPFVKIVKRSEVMKKADIFTGKSTKDYGDESVVVQMVELENITYKEAQEILTNFVLDPAILTSIPNTNYLIITDYAERITRILDILALVDVPGPERRLEIMVPRYITASDAHSQIDVLLNALSEQQATMAKATPATPPVRRQIPKRPVRPPTRKPTAPNTPTVTKLNKPTLLEDKRSDRLLVIGTEEQIDEVRHLLSLFDTPLPKSKIKLEPIGVEYVSASEVIKQIDSLINALNSQMSNTNEPATVPARVPAGPAADKDKKPTPPRPRSRVTTSTTTTPSGAYMQADERTNRILAVGTDEQLTQVKDLLSLLDVELPLRDIKLIPIEVKYVLAADVSGQIVDLMTAIQEQMYGGDKGVQQSPDRSTARPDKGKTTQPPTVHRTDTRRTATSSNLAGPGGPYIQVDERTNRLLIVGVEEQIGQVRDLLSLLDIPVPGAEIKLIPMVPEHLQAEKAVDQISELIMALTEQEEEQEIGETGTTASATQTLDQTKKTPGTRSPNTAQSPTRRMMDRNQREFIKTSSTGPILVADVRTNRMFIIGNDEQIEQVKELLKILDVDINLKLIPVQIKHVLTSDIADQLSSLIEALTEDSGEGTSRSTSSRYGRDQESRTTGIRTMPGLSGERRTSSRGRSRYGGRQGSVASNFVSTGSQGPMLLPDERTNRLLIVGTQEQIDMVTELLPLLDVPPGEFDRLELRIYQPKYVGAKEVLDILDQLGITQQEREDSGLRRGEGPERGRTIIGDRGGTGPSTEQPRLAGEGEVIAGLEEPEIRTAVQETTNRLFVLATAYQLRDIEKIMENIDTDPCDLLGEIQIYQLENQEPAFVADSLKELLHSERYEQQGDKQVFVPGKEGAPIILPLEDIFAIGVRGSAKQHRDIKKIIDTLDKRLPQVLIEAILVQVSSDDALKVGFSMKESYSVKGTGGSEKRGISGVSPFNIGTLTKAGKIVTGTGGTIAFFSDDFIYAALEALQEQQEARVISKPRVLVNSNQEATINSKREKPTTRTTIPAGSDTPIIEFADYVDAGTELKIKPNISEHRENADLDFLKLEITLSVNSFEGEGTENVPPPKASNSVTTSVTVPNNKIIVLGGLTTTTDATTVQKIPLLGDIPLIGALFRNVVRTENSGVLYVFLKANIVKKETFEDIELLTEKNTSALKDFETNYNRQSLIPGIPEQGRDKRNRALDDEDYKTPILKQ